jgi:hypothetical protein
MEPASLLEHDRWLSFRDDQGRIESREQPWKAYYPPNPTYLGSEVWEKSEFPEVTSFQFDSRNPFDRPWRKWTRTALAKLERCDAPLKTQEIIEQCTLETQTGLSNTPISCPENRGRCQSQLNAANMLDKLISQNKIKRTNLASFGYLAPSSLYEREKPYLSRLPALPGFLRTNIVGKSYKVFAHDISGHEDLFKLDECGFEYIKCPDSVGEWSDSSISAAYIPSLGLWLKDLLNCEEVYTYAYSVSY